MPQDYRHDWNQRVNAIANDEMHCFNKKLSDEYDMYLAYTDDEYPLSFDEWLNN